MSVEWLSAISVVLVALITVVGAIAVKRTRDRDTEPEDPMVTLVNSLPLEQQGLINILMEERRVDRELHQAELATRDATHAAVLAARDSAHTAQLSEINGRLVHVEGLLGVYRNRIQELIHWGRYDPSPPPRVEPPGIAV